VKRARVRECVCALGALSKTTTIASLVLDRRPQDVHVSLQALGEALQVLGAWWLLAQAQFQRTVANAASMRRMLYHLEVKLKVSGRLGNIVHG